MFYYFCDSCVRDMHLDPDPVRQFGPCCGCGQDEACSEFEPRELVHAAQTVSPNTKCAACLREIARYVAPEIPKPQELHNALDAAQAKAYVYYI